MANRLCTTLNCCVSDIAGEVRFQKITGYSEMLSGIVDKYEVEHVQRIRDEMQDHGGSSEMISMTARTFADIATEHGLFEINYLSIDTEGGELEILRSIDFKKFFVHAISAEYQDPPARDDDGADARAEFRDDQADGKRSSVPQPPERDLSRL